jgi:hypothetical protein
LEVNMMPTLLLGTFLGLLGGSVFSLTACGDKMECTDMTGRGCYEVGIPEDSFAGWCDECGQLYLCGGGEVPVLRQSIWPCSCIDEDGYFNQLDEQCHATEE